MAVEIIMPKLGVDMQEGEIIEWKKAEGELVQEGDILLEIMSDKTNMEIEAEDSGILLKIVHKAGDVVPVTEIIGYLGAEGEVIDEVVTNYKLLDRNFEYICCIYACAPFVTCKKLLDSFQLLQQNEFDSVFPIQSFGFPIQRALRFGNNKISFFYPEYSSSRSQDLEKSYHDAGQFYWMNTEVCLNKKQIFTDNTGSIIISELEGQDIDNEVDWKLAELKYELIQSIK